MFVTTGFEDKVIDMSVNTDTDASDYQPLMLSLMD